MLFNTSTGRLFFFSTEPQSCSYLSDREAVMLFADPNKVVDTDTYGRLIDYGFRRSGDNVYRPHCRNCTACVPVRIPVDEFVPSRSQRRALTRNRDLRIVMDQTEFHDGHQSLYLAYQRSRHDAGVREKEVRDQLGFLRSRFIETSFIEYFLDDQLVMVSVIDSVGQGLSAVYTFFDPDYSGRGLGTFAILNLIEVCRERDLPWLYLGYWIKESPKMNYKTRFRPLHAYIQGSWVPLEEDMCES